MEPQREKRDWKDLKNIIVSWLKRYVSLDNDFAAWLDDDTDGGNLLVRYQERKTALPHANDSKELHIKYLLDLWKSNVASKANAKTPAASGAAAEDPE